MIAIPVEIQEALKDDGFKNLVRILSLRASMLKLSKSIYEKYPQESFAASFLLQDRTAATLSRIYEGSHLHDLWNRIKQSDDHFSWATFIENRPPGERMGLQQEIVFRLYAELKPDRPVPLGTAFLRHWASTFHGMDVSPIQEFVFCHGGVPLFDMLSMTLYHANLDAGLTLKSIFIHIYLSDIDKTYVSMLFDVCLARNNPTALSKLIQASIWCINYLPVSPMKAISAFNLVEGTRQKIDFDAIELAVVTSWSERHILQWGKVISHKGPVQKYLQVREVMEG